MAVASAALQGLELVVVCHRKSWAEQCTLLTLSLVAFQVLANNGAPQLTTRLSLEPLPRALAPTLEEGVPHSTRLLMKIHAVLWMKGTQPPPRTHLITRAAVVATVTGTETA